MNKLRIIDTYVNELDCPLLPQLGPVVSRRVSMNGEVTTRKFVKVTKDMVLASEFDGPMWADIITGTLYDMHGRSGSAKVFMKGVK